MTQEQPIDPFEGAETIPGLEHLGRAIVGADGSLSGSPANYEALRGKTGTTPLSAEEVEAQVEAIREMFPA